MKPTDKQLYWMITNKRKDPLAWDDTDYLEAEIEGPGKAEAGDPDPVLLGGVLRSTFRQIVKPPRGMPRRIRRRRRSAR